MKTSIAFQVQKSISVQMYMYATLTSDITCAFALRSCRTTFALISCRTAFALSSCITSFALNIRPELLQNNIHPQLLQNSIRPQLLQNGKFLLQALPPIVGLTLFGFFW